MNLANKLANKAPERQHPRQVLPAVARDGEAYCSMSFQKPAAFAFILFFGGGSPTGVFFSGGSRIGGPFSDGGLTGGFFGSFGGSLRGDLTAFFMEIILMCVTPEAQVNLRLAVAEKTLGVLRRRSGRTEGS